MYKLQTKQMENICEIDAAVKTGFIVKCRRCKFSEK
jgi:hypothetical protein